MCIEREREIEEKGKEMALETVVYPNDYFSHGGCKDFFSLVNGGSGWNYDFGLKHEEEEEEEEDEHLGFVGLLQKMDNQSLVDNYAFPPPLCLEGNGNDYQTQTLTQIQPQTTTNPSETLQTTTSAGTTSTSSRRKRRRTKINKNKEEVESQRMTHIVVERNRRKQMNDYLAVLRSLMPASYVQRSDQASIIGGAINFVKELEQFLQSLEAQKKIKEEPDVTPFANFFAYPQYTSSASASASSCSAQTKEFTAENRSPVADIEVTMAESHANLKIVSKKRPKQILKMVVGFQALYLTILHLNVTTVDEVVLYSFSVKVEDECELKSVDEIASAVHKILEKIEDEAALN